MPILAPPYSEIRRNKIYIRLLMFSGRTHRSAPYTLALSGHPRSNNGHTDPPLRQLSRTQHVASLLANKKRDATRCDVSTMLMLSGTRKGRPYFQYSPCPPPSGEVGRGFFLLVEKFVELLCCDSLLFESNLCLESCAELNFYATVDEVVNCLTLLEHFND